MGCTPLKTVRRHEYCGVMTHVQKTRNESLRKEGRGKKREDSVFNSEVIPSSNDSWMGNTTKAEHVHVQ